MSPSPEQMYQLQQENQRLRSVLQQAHRSTKQHEHALKIAKQSKRSLLASLPMYEAMLDAALDSIISINLFGEIIEYNAMAEQMFGYSREYALGKALHNLIIPPDMRAKHLQGLQHWQQRSLQNVPFSVRMETIGLHADGSIFPVELSITKVQRADTFFFTGFIRDLTEHKRSAQLLAKSEEKYHHLFNNAADMIHVVGADGCILDANATELQALGYDRNTLIGKPLLEIIAPELQSKTSTILQALDEGQHTIRYESILISASGQRLPVEVRATPQRQDGKLTQITAVIRDITERKQAEEKLKEKELRLRTFIAVNPVPTLISRKCDGIIQYVNAALENLLGFSQEILIGHKVTEILVSPELREERWLALTQANALEDQVIDVKKSDGNSIQSLVSLANLEFDNEPSVMATLSDITERMQLTAQLSQSLEATIQVIARVEEARDPYTAGHQSRVAELSCEIGLAMGLDSKLVEGLHWGGMIHDIGKIHLPSEILSKPTKLTTLEYDLIKEHAQIGYQILENIKFPWPIADIIHQHHERLDGSGYPQALRGEQICLQARIVAVADVVEAMASHRPYRPGLGIKKALAEISRGRGEVYDSQVVDCCLALFTEKQFSFTNVQPR